MEKITLNECFMVCSIEKVTMMRPIEQVALHDELILAIFTRLK